MNVNERVPFLMYHAVRSPSDGDDFAESDPVYTASVERFGQQLAYLRRSGFESVTLSEYVAWHRYGDPLPAKPVVLTFDDGHPSHVKTVLPQLRAHGFRGVFAVVPAWVGTARSVSLEQLGEMKEAGMEIVSHGLHHVPLSDLPLQSLRQELEESKARLESWLGEPVRFLAIPRGYSSVKVRQAAYDAGYLAVCTSRPGYNTRSSDLFSLARIPIKAHHQIADFTALVEAHPARRIMELGGYAVRRGAQRLLGSRRYDRLRQLLLHPSEETLPDA